MMSKPIAFMSYARFDDKNDDGYITKLCKRLSDEVRAHTGKEFPIFQDQSDIKWGENWKERIEGSIDSVTFFIPIITPSFFKSDSCLDELKQFKALEEKKDRNDLILPIYYISCSQLEADSFDEATEIIKKRQFMDWRDLRRKSQNSVKFNKKLGKLALDISSAIDRIQASQGAIYERDSDVRIDYALNEKSINEDKETKRKIFEENIKHTIIVDKNQNGDFATIKEAIIAARPGDRIAIRPGIYEEDLFINKSLEIVGEGDLNLIILKIKGKSVITSIASNGLVANLSLRQEGGNWFCVDIPYGSIEINGCDISSSGSSCIGIHHQANPILKHNRIHNSAQGGVFVFDNGKGLLEDNDIFENSFSGIEIKNFGDPTLRLNRIYDGKQGGIFAHDNGIGVFEKNEIFWNRLGIEIKNGGNPAITGNRIYENNEMGIMIHNNGLGCISDNDFFNNGYDAIGIRSNANPIVRHNRIHDGKQGGIFILDNGLGVIEDNDIFSNSSDGIAIKSQGNPKIRHNRVFGGKSDGIYICDNGLGVIEDNDINNNIFGIEIKTESDPVIQRNIIHDNRSSGIRILENGRGIIENNEIFQNELAGIQICTMSDPKVSYNRIHDSKMSGIVIHDNGKGIIEYNDIFKSAVAGIEIQNSGKLSIKGNNIRSGQDGILIQKSKAIIELNNILLNRFCGIIIGKDGNPVIINNKININGLNAIRIIDDGSGSISDNDLRGNSGGAWCIKDNLAEKISKVRNLE